MDKLKALSIEKELKGKEFNGFTILNFLNNGKSAAVFKAVKEGVFYALKIFDNQLIERFGHEIQTKRIEQEIALKNHDISNLVKIFEGGTASIEGQEYYYLVMEFINGVNLKFYIQNKVYDEGFIKNTLCTLLVTTNDLLTKKQIVHRDIKPENIMVDESGKIILMDLGVLKLVGAKSFSDEEEKQFVGTLRYAAPEFLMRNEIDSNEGWKAVNLYQIGATIHDLIMKQELFFDKTPYSNLVIAIKDDKPKISNQNTSFNLQQLTRNMLTKDWKTRLSLCKNEEILSVCKEGSEPENLTEKGIDEILKARLGHQAKFDEIEKLRRTKAEIRKNQQAVGQKLIGEINNSFYALQAKGIFTKFKKSDNFRFDSDMYSNVDVMLQNVLYELEGDLKMGFPRNLFLLIRVSNNEENFTEIEMLGIFPFSIAKANIANPTQFFQEVIRGRTRINQHNTNVNINLASVFKGIIEFDKSFQDFLTGKIVQLILKSLQTVEDIVKRDLEWEEQIAKSKNRAMSRTIQSPGNILIDKL